MDPTPTGPPAYEPPDPLRPASASPTEPELERETPGGIRSGGHDPYLAFRTGNYRLYTAGSMISVVGQQMLGVAVGWDLFLRTRSTTALGLVGLVQAVPIIGLVLFAGHAADRLDRKRIVMLAQAVVAACAVGFAAVALRGEAAGSWGAVEGVNQGLRWLARTLGESGVRFDDPAVPLMYGLLLVMGTARAFNAPARQALLPRIVPPEAFSNAVTWNSTVFQVASMFGPALGGMLLGMGAGTPSAGRFAGVYLAVACCAAAMGACVAAVRVRPGEPAAREPVTLGSLAAGMRFVWRTKIILATITLDLFAVLLGGAVALLPVFAREVLHTDAAGLGWLRAAESLGAFAMAVVLAHRPPMRRAGRALLWAVAGFGAAMIGFGLSRWFWLSFGMLVLAGAFDNISVVVRHTLVQVLTPDAMRGRVSAVNSVFIGTSNELGAFESGVTAALFGPVVSVVAGGIGTILVVLAVAVAWPEVRRFGALDRARPAD